jgi:F-type H+-transporting ATPase subunit delta
MKGTEAVARRYARAALDVALAQGETGFREDLDELDRVFETSGELRTVFLHPAIPAEKKTGLVAALWGGRRPSELLLRLINLLAQRERLELLPLVARAYRRLWNAHRGVVEAEAVSARALDDTEAHAVSEAAGRAVGRQVDLQRRVDPDLMGGLLLRMEGRVYDGTVRARLRALRERLAGTEG